MFWRCWNPSTHPRQIPASPSLSSRRMSWTPLAGDVFVGRHREMDDQKAALEDALGGRGRMVTLVGEPGVGKTRTAQELVTYARLRGVQVLWGRCYEDRGMPPYWPWVQAIRSYMQNTDPEQLRSEMGAGAADIAEIVSDVRDQFPDLPTPQLAEPEQARFRLHDAIATLLKNASQKLPIMLVLDDIHWSDTASLLLLEFVARELSGARLLLVGTYRDMELNRRHPLAQTLGELTRERLFQRVLLRGLSQEDVGHFIEATSGVVPPTGLVEAVHTQTEGNPLFVTEVVRLFVQENELTRLRRDTESWTVRIPEGVREVIGRRLDRLSERCNDTLTIASVIGREFGLDQLDALIEDISQDRLVDLLDEALSARVIEELSDAAGRYQFTHALIQETLSEELSLTRRTRLHARIAESLEELYGADAEANAAELVHHFARAETVLGIEKLVRYSIIAGEQAIGAKAFEAAFAHFQRASATMEGQVIDEQIAAILHGLGRAQMATAVGLSDRQAALDNLRRALDYYIETADVPRAMDVAVAAPSFTIQGLKADISQMNPVVS
jgi:predicted ATPase